MNTGNVKNAHFYSNSLEVPTKEFKFSRKLKFKRKIYRQTVVKKVFWVEFISLTKFEGILSFIENLWEEFLCLEEVSSLKIK